MINHVSCRRVELIMKVIIYAEPICFYYVISLINYHDKTHNKIGKFIIIAQGVYSKNKQVFKVSDTLLQFSFIDR